MRRANTTIRRAGFTLIEMITVIAIMMILLALTAAAVFRVSASQQRKTTEVMLDKIVSAFEQKWKSVIETARKEPMVDTYSPTPGTSLEVDIMAWAGNDSARARALWIRMRLFQEFPHSFSEVLNGAVGSTYTTASTAGGVTLIANKTLALNQVTLYSKKTYRDALIKAGAKHSPDPGVTAKAVYNFESAALLYMILSTNTAGMAANADEFGASSSGDYALSGINFKVFKDVWGTPIAFRRYGINAVHLKDMNELSAPPYAPTGTVSADPLDPEGKLRTNWNSGTGTAGNPERLLFHYLHRDYYTDATGPHNNLFNTNDFPNRNFGPLIFSAGPDKLFHTDDAADLGSSRSIANDDILGFRLRRAGQGGN